MRHSVPPQMPPQDEVKVAVYRDSLPATESDSQLSEKLIAAGLIGMGLIGLISNL